VVTGHLRLIDFVSVPSGRNSSHPHTIDRNGGHL
jgi:hypothetical protein